MLTASVCPQGMRWLAAGAVPFNKAYLKYVLCTALTHIPCSGLLLSDHSSRRPQHKRRISQRLPPKPRNPIAIPKEMDVHTSPLTGPEASNNRKRERLPLHRPETSPSRARERLPRLSPLTPYPAPSLDFGLADPAGSPTQNHTTKLSHRPLYSRVVGFRLVCDTPRRSGVDRAYLLQVGNQRCQACGWWWWPVRKTSTFFVGFCFPVPFRVVCVCECVSVACQVRQSTTSTSDQEPMTARPVRGGVGIPRKRWVRGVPSRRSPAR